VTAPLNPPASAGSRIVLAIDPGSVKCGLALVSHPPTHVLAQRVVPVQELLEYAGRFVAAHPDLEILIGRGTGSAGITTEIRSSFPRTTLRLVDERDTSRRARERYCRDNPPTGLRRLLPAGLRYPEAPYDDYVAIILAEEFLRESGS
jgi:hypothetical protein